MLQWKRNNHGYGCTFNAFAEVADNDDKEYEND